MKLGYFLDRFSKNTQIPNFMKIRPIGAELIYADRWTDGQADLTELTAAFCERV
jgi:hypothetical protein